MSKRFSHLYRNILSTFTLFLLFPVGVHAQYIPDGPVGGDLISWVHRGTNLVILVQFLIAGLCFFLAIWTVLSSKRKRKKGEKDPKAVKLFMSCVLLTISSFLEVLFVNYFSNGGVILTNPTLWQKMMNNGYVALISVYLILFVSIFALVKIWKKEKSDA